MKKILSTIAATAVLATSSFALDTDKAYMAASLGLESYTSLDSGIAIIIAGGLPVMAKGEAGPGTLAVEAEMSFDLSAPSLGTLEASVFTMGGYAAYSFDINEQFFVKPRVGLIYKSVSIDSGSAWGTADASEIGLAFGVQGGYKIDKQLDVIVGYNLVDGSNITHLTAGIQYHF